MLRPLSWFIHIMQHYSTRSALSLSLTVYSMLASYAAMIVVSYTARQCAGTQSIFGVF